MPPPGPAFLRGTITAGACGTPVEGEDVFLYRGATSFVIGTTKSDSAGRYEFSGISTGQYVVGFVDQQGIYLSSYYPDAPDIAAAKAIAVGTEGKVVDEKLFTPNNVASPPYGDTSAKPARRIAVVGDSLVQLSTTIIRNRLDPLGAPSVRGISNQTTEQLMPIAEKMALTDPRTVVLVVGNNDVRQSVAVESSMKSLVSMLALFRNAACVVVLNLNTHTFDQHFNAGAQEFNKRLAATVTLTPKVQIADWDSAVGVLLADNADPSTWFIDGLHTTEAGGAAFASTMHDAVASCPA